MNPILVLIEEFFHRSRPPWPKQRDRPRTINTQRSRYEGLSQTEGMTMLSQRVLHQPLYSCHVDRYDNTVHIRHILHPFRSARELARRGGMAFYRQLASRRLGHISRTSRDRCWCGGELLPFQWHESYGVCSRCTAYVNRRPPIREELHRLYSLDLFWRIRQKERGSPTLESRAAYYRSDGRLQQWLSLIERYGPQSGTVIEIGCAPGVLLEELRSRSYSCVGIEISDEVANWLRETTHLDIRSGFFPGIDLPVSDLFLAFDVLEHSPCPDEFMREAARHLRPGGIAIIQTPIDRYAFHPPFGNRSDLFDDVEHLFLFTDRALEALAGESNMEIISLKENLWLGGEVCVFRKTG